MKKQSIVLFITVLIGIKSFSQNPPMPIPEKKLKVEFTLQEWVTKLNILNYITDLLKQSDVPTKVSLPIMDSIASISRSFTTQLQPQLPKDTTNKK